MCNRVVQNDVVVKPGGKMTVLMRGPGGEFELPFDEAVFGGPAKRESRNYWLKREGAVDVLVPHVSRFGEKNKTTGEQGWEDVPAESALEGLLLPQPPGKEYRLLKIVTQPATRSLIISASSIESISIGFDPGIWVKKCGLKRRKFCTPHNYCLPCFPNFTAGFLTLHRTRKASANRNHNCKAANQPGNFRSSGIP